MEGIVDICASIAEVEAKESSVLDGVGELAGKTPKRRQNHRTVNTLKNPYHKDLAFEISFFPASTHSRFF